MQVSGAKFESQLRIPSLHRYRASLFLPEAAAEYLRFNAQLDPEKEDILVCQNQRSDAVTVFAVQKELNTWLNSIYANTRLTLVHQSAALIEGVLEYAKANENPLYIYVDRFKLHILSVSNGKLLYYNQFLIKQFSDYVKYIMLVLKGLGMDQNNSQIVLWGLHWKKLAPLPGVCKIRTQCWLWWPTCLPQVWLLV
jgi:hypothetical protein